MGFPVDLNQTAQVLPFLLVLSSDHLTGATGKSPAVLLSKNGGGFATPAGAVTEIGNGWYQVAGNATDANTLGPLLLHASATGCDPTDDCFPVVAYNPQDAAALGLSTLTGNVPQSVDVVTKLPGNFGSLSISPGGKINEVALLDTLAPASFGSLAPGALNGLGDWYTGAGTVNANVVAVAPGAITDAAFTMPGEAAGRPSTFLATVRRLWEWRCNKRNRDRSTGTVTLRNAADTLTLETQTQVTVGTVDTQTKGV